MQKGQLSTIRPPEYLRVHESAIAQVAAASQSAHLPPSRATMLRKWRAPRGGTPSPLERTAALMVELHRAGTPIATLRGWVQMLADLLDNLTTGTARPKLTLDALRREMALEHVENGATLDLMAERTPATLRAYAAAGRAEAMHTLELCRAAEIEARELERTARSA